MIQINLSEAPKQQFNAPITGGYDTAEIYLEFKPLQNAWFMDLTWGDFVLKNERVSNSPNLLRQFRDLIPFGIFVAGRDDIDPLLITSWTGDNEFWILDSTDLEYVETLYER